jgi:hypothetical protein
MGGGDDKLQSEEVLDFGESSPSPANPVAVSERIALETHWLRIGVAAVTLLTFIVLNTIVLWGLNSALQFDFEMLRKPTPGYVRFVNTEVILSILGATTVQLGAMMIAIAKFLFPPSNG